MNLIASTLMLLIDLAPHKPEICGYGEIMNGIHFHTYVRKPINCSNVVRSNKKIMLVFLSLTFLYV